MIDSCLIDVINVPNQDAQKWIKLCYSVPRTCCMYW